MKISDIATRAARTIVEPTTDGELVRLLRPADRVLTDDGRILKVRSWKITLGPDRVPLIEIEGVMTSCDLADDPEKAGQ